MHLILQRYEHIHILGRSTASSLTSRQNAWDGVLHISVVGESEARAGLSLTRL